MLRRVFTLGFTDTIERVRHSAAASALVQELQTVVKQRKSVASEDLSRITRLASRALSDATGYARVESLKDNVRAVEDQLVTANDTLKQCRMREQHTRQLATDLRAQVNALLERQHAWSDTDVHAFTAAHRDAANAERDASVAERDATAAEHAVESTHGKLTAAILARYHAETAWSDQMRAVAAWGAWLVVAANVLLLVVVQLVLEPWRRGRLVRSFTAAVEKANVQREKELLQMLQTLEMRSLRGEVRLFVNHSRISLKHYSRKLVLLYYALLLAVTKQTAAWTSSVSARFNNWYNHQWFTNKV